MSKRRAEQNFKNFKYVHLDHILRTYRSITEAKKDLSMRNNVPTKSASSIQSVAKSEIKGNFLNLTSMYTQRITPTVLLLSLKIEKSMMFVGDSFVTVDSDKEEKRKRTETEDIFEIIGTIID